jgi:preprotein translocase subunit YajC
MGSGSGPLFLDSRKAFCIMARSMSPLDAIQAQAPAAPAAPSAPAAAPAAPAAPATGAPSTSQPAPAPADPGGPGGLGMFMPLILMFVVFYFLLLRPQRKQQKEREAAIAALKKNDHVLTHAGIYGIVKQVQDQDLVLCIDENKDVRIRVAKSAVAGLVKTAGGEAAGAEAKADSAEKK